MTEQERGKCLREDVVRAHRIPDLAGHFVFLVARLWHAARHCGVCNRREVASVDLSGEVVGQGRMGIRLMSLVAYLDTIARMPVELIQGLLRSLFGLSLSTGQVCEILQKVAEKGKPIYDELLVKLRAGPFANADETGWRENGKNGYAWSFSNADLEYFVCQRNRSADVAREVLGETFAGTLVSDLDLPHFHRQEVKRLSHSQACC